MLSSRMLCGVLFAASLLMAQSIGQSANVNKAHSEKSRGDITIRGCLSMSVVGGYLLRQADSRDTYNLEKGSREISLGPHVGEQVEVTGWESNALSTSSDALNRTGSAASVTLMVISIRTTARRCPVAGEAK